MQLLKLSEIVINWYKKNLRVLPWRPKNFNQKINVLNREIYQDKKYSDIIIILNNLKKLYKNFKKKDYEKMFNKYLNIKNFIWLKKGIAGDDTHGHVDDISRFVSRNTIMTAVENNKKDINYKSLNKNLNILKESKCEKGKKFKIIKVPMPSPIYIENTRVPASYMNFYICNKKIILPIFRVKEDNIAIKIFKNYFRNRKIETVDCSKLIWGFGAIHCMTQQEPKI